MADTKEETTLKSKTFNSKRLGEITLRLTLVTSLKVGKYYECQIDFVDQNNKETVLEDVALFNQDGNKIINQYYDEYTLESIEYSVDCCIEFIKTKALVI